MFYIVSIILIIHHQASVNQMSGAGPLVQNALGSMLEILKQEVFNATSVSCYLTEFCLIFVHKLCYSSLS